jgi:hypothetical protein
LKRTINTITTRIIAHQYDWKNFPEFIRNIVEAGKLTFIPSKIDMNFGIM